MTSQVVLEGDSLSKFKSKVRQRITAYENSYEPSINVLKKEFSDNLRKKGWFRKPIVAEGEEITEEVLEKYLLGNWNHRTPSQMKRLQQTRIAYLNKFLEVRSKLIIDIGEYSTIMNQNYTEFFYNLT